MVSCWWWTIWSLTSLQCGNYANIGIMGEQLCQPLCILHNFNKCIVNICICICVCVFCKQTCRKAGEDQICILISISILYFKIKNFDFNFVFQKYEKAQQAFCVQYWFPKSSHQKPTFCKISNLLCLLKSPGFPLSAQSQTDWVLHGWTLEATCCLPLIGFPAPHQ